MSQPVKKVIPSIALVTLLTVGIMFNPFFGVGSGSVPGVEGGENGGGSGADAGGGAGTPDSAAAADNGGSGAASQGSQSSVGTPDPDGIFAPSDEADDGDADATADGAADETTAASGGSVDDGSWLGLFTDRASPMVTTLRGTAGQFQPDSRLAETLRGPMYQF